MKNKENPNRAQRNILKKYRAPYDPRTNNFIEIDNQQREFFFQMEKRGRAKWIQENVRSAAKSLYRHTQNLNFVRYYARTWTQKFIQRIGEHKIKITWQSIWEIIEKIWEDRAPPKYKTM